MVLCSSDESLYRLIAVWTLNNVPRFIIVSHVDPDTIQYACLDEDHAHGPHCRDSRISLTRPSTAEISEYAGIEHICNEQIIASC